MTQCMICGKQIVSGIVCDSCLKGDVDLAYTEMLTMKVKEVKVDKEK